MKTTLRVKFMSWLTLHTLITFLATAAILFVFNLKERGEHPDLAEEETEELLTVFGFMSLALPVVLLAAWGISGQLLKPLQSIIRSAQVIREGKLEHRIDAEIEHDEIGKLARTINEAFDSYQNALRRLDRFSFDVAHQLRNPLAAIRTEGEVCLQRPRAAQEYQETLGRILEDARRLGHTVDQLLTLARLGRGELAGAFQELNFGSLLGEILDDLAPVIEEKQLSLQKSLPAERIAVRGIPNLLREAVVNLLDNAIRFTPEGGRLGVELRGDGSQSVLLSVADSGPGIPATRWEGIFGRSRPLNGSSNEGTGLGLAIASDVIRAHHGSIKITSSDWGGAKFTILLPRQ